jgi:hypothetical protein
MQDSRLGLPFLGFRVICHPKLQVQNCLSICREYRGLRVVNVHPGVVETAMTKKTRILSKGDCELCAITYGQ